MTSSAWTALLSVYAYGISLLTRLLLRVLAAGPIPQHIGFVMDGNRRFARQRNRHVLEGHSEGFESLKNVLEVCLRLKIRCVSIYVFSIENFSRPQEEVDGLMDMARGRFRELAERGELLDRYGVRVNIIGQTSLLPPDVQTSVREMEILTRNNDKAILNVCMPYTSRDEITSAIQKTCSDASIPSASSSQREKINSITPETIYNNLPVTLASSPPLSILVRTSGVHRLSDFLLWQASRDAKIYFVDVFWPDFGMRQMTLVLLSWQRSVWAARGLISSSSLASNTDQEGDGLVRTARHDWTDEKVPITEHP